MLEGSDEWLPLFTLQGELSQLLSPFSLCFLVLCLVPLLTQQPALESLGISLVLAATAGCAGKDLASATESKRAALVVLWTILFLVYYSMVLAFFIKYMTEHHLKRDLHLTSASLLFPGRVQDVSKRWTQCQSSIFHDILRMTEAQGCLCTWRCI